MHRAVIASSLDANALFENSERALKLLFWLGTRVQLAYPIITLSPAILADSLAHDEGVFHILIGPFPCFFLRILSGVWVRGDALCDSEHRERHMQPLI